MRLQSSMLIPLNTPTVTCIRHVSQTDAHGLNSTDLRSMYALIMIILDKFM